MKDFLKNTWNLLNVTVKEASKNTPIITINENSYSSFEDNFKKLYNLIKKDFMDDSVEFLDRHKVASIIIISILKSNAIIYEGKIENNKKFFGQYLIATSVGINYMQNKLNKMLLNKNKAPITKLWFPKSLSCNNSYFEIMCRNLYFSHTSSELGLNPLDIAEKLFLLEYITLEKNEIDPLILKKEQK